MTLAAVTAPTPHLPCPRCHHVTPAVTLALRQARLAVYRDHKCRACGEWFSSTQVVCGADLLVTDGAPRWLCWLCERVIAAAAWGCGRR